MTSCPFPSSGSRGLERFRACCPRVFLSFNFCAIMSSKRKRTLLTIQKKCELLDKLDKGVPVVNIIREYGVAKQTISDIKKCKDKIRAFGSAVKENPKSNMRMTFKKGYFENLEKAIVKWYRQEESVGVAVRGYDIQAAAKRLAVQMNVPDFNASDGWLYRFRRRHGMFQKRKHGESGSANVDDVDPFRTELNRLIKDEGLIQSQVYNFDETGLFWRALPECTQVMSQAKQAKGRKLDKTRFSVLCGANADGSHRLTPIVVGKSARPRCLKDCFHSLPCHYYSGSKDWFTSYIFKDCFFKHIVPEIVKFQREVLNISEDRIRALVLLDNAPAHPAKEQLVAHNGRIRVMFLPPNTTSVIQPMDQGVIHATKLIYRRLFLGEVLVVEETEEDEEHDTRGLRTLERLRNYNLRHAIFNFCEAWKQVKVSTLANSWKRLLKDVETPIVDFDGFEVRDFRAMLADGGENVHEREIESWLEMDDGDPGHHILSETEIADSVMHPPEEVEEDSDEGETSFTCKLSAARDHLDALIQFVDHRQRDFSSSDFENLRSIRRKVIDLQHSSGKQSKISNFFRSRTPTPTTSPVTTPEPVPSTSTGVSESFMGFSPPPFRTESDSE